LVRRRGRRRGRGTGGLRIRGVLVAARGEQQRRRQAHRDYPATAPRLTHGTDRLSDDTPAATDWEDARMLDDDAARLSPPVTDVLGEPWVQRRISLRPTPEDPRPEAVLVQQREPTQGRRAVLYLHGFSDYFFQTGHAERWAAAGFDFYALDLRLSGRAIGDRPRPGDVR